MAKLICPHCNKENTNYNIKDETIDCRFCNRAFSIKKGFVSNLKNDHKKYQDAKGMTLESNGKELNLTIDWSSVTRWHFTLTFGIVLTIFMGGILLLLWNNNPIELIIMGVFILIFFTTGLYLLYQGLFELLNKTNINIANGEIYVSHRFTDRTIKPIQIATKDLAQVFVKRKTGGSSGKKEYYYHEVFLQTKSGATFIIANKIKYQETAYFIENKIESFLNIEDKILSHEFHPKTNLSEKETSKIASTVLLAEMRNKQTTSYKNICPSCKSPIQDNNISNGKDVVYCSECQESFLFNQSVILKETMEHKEINQTPKNMKFYSDTDRLEISWTTKNMNAIFLFILAVITTIFLVKNSAPWFMFTLEPILLYLGSIIFFTKHTVRISKRYLWIDRFPTFLFQTESTEYKRKNVYQLYVTRKIISDGDDGKKTIYQLIMVDHKNKEHLLINHHPNHSGLFFVERKVEEFLNIDDKPMPGEFNPNINSSPQNFTEAINFVREKIKTKNSYNE